jgi:hypothetical protein
VTASDAPAPIRADDAAERIALLIQLRAARKLLEQPGVWTKGPDARNGAGEFTKPTDMDAVHFSLDGALRHVNGGALGPAYKLLKDIVGKNVFDFNDDPRTKLTDILNLLDSAIQRTERAHAAALALASVA